MSERIPIQAQIDEVEAVYVSRQAWLAQRAEAVARGKTVPPDTGCVKSGMPSLDAAIRTLKLVRDNAEAFRAVLAERDEASA